MTSDIPLLNTAYFPPVQWLAVAARHPKIWIEVKETFPKQTYRNRMHIMTAGGVRPLTVPTVRHNHSRTDEVTIDYTTRWQTIHLRTLAAAYSASPYFLYYRDELEALLATRHLYLIDLNLSTIRWMFSKLKIECVAEHTDDYCPAEGAPLDYRTRISPKVAFDASAFKPYYQVFSDRFPFEPNLSGLDLLMNLGPDSGLYLRPLADLQ